MYKTIKNNIANIWTILPKYLQMLAQHSRLFRLKVKQTTNIFYYIERKKKLK